MEYAMVTVSSALVIFGAFGPLNAIVLKHGIVARPECARYWAKLGNSMLLSRMYPPELNSTEGMQTASRSETGT